MVAGRAADAPMVNAGSTVVTGTATQTAVVVQVRTLAVRIPVDLTRVVRIPVAG